jgi:hypothetical protein
MILISLIRWLCSEIPQNAKSNGVLDFVLDFARTLSS